MLFASVYTRPRGLTLDAGAISSGCEAQKSQEHATLLGSHS